jgi:hypothetical protein
MVKRGTKRKSDREKDKKQEKRPKTIRTKELVLTGSDSGSGSDSGRLFEEADPDSRPCKQRMLPLRDNVLFRRA